MAAVSLPTGPSSVLINVNNQGEKEDETEAAEASSTNFRLNRDRNVFSLSPDRIVWAKTGTSQEGVFKSSVCPLIGDFSPVSITKRHIFTSESQQNTALDMCLRRNLNPHVTLDRV